jgi:hypothetical protein
LKVIENLECPKGIVSEIKRALKQDGLLLVSTPDKQAYSNQRNYRHPDHRRETYVPEIQKLSGQHSEHLRTYRQGTVVGAFISQAHAEDVGLLRDERQQGQETEVLTFQEALRFRKSEPAYLRAQVDRLEAGRSTWKSYRAVSTVWETSRSGGCPTLIGGYEPGYEP